MNRSTFNQFMDVEHSSGKLFPNWEEARAYYTTHYHKACMHIIPPSFPPNSPKKKKSKTDKTDKSGGLSDAPLIPAGFR